MLVIGNLAGQYSTPNVDAFSCEARSTAHFEASLRVAQYCTQGRRFGKRASSAGRRS